MSQELLSQVLDQVLALSPEDQSRLLKVLSAPTEAEQRIEAARLRATAWSLRDSSADFNWLQAHRREFAGQWVALKDGQLISHGLIAKEVFAAARLAGHPDAMITLVEPESPENVKIINVG